MNVQFIFIFLPLDMPEVKPQSWCFPQLYFRLVHCAKTVQNCPIYANCICNLSLEYQKLRPAIEQENVTISFQVGYGDIAPITGLGKVISLS